MGKHMGCDVSWTFIWRPDGAFYEEVGLLSGSRYLIQYNIAGTDAAADGGCKQQLEELSILQAVVRAKHSPLQWTLSGAS